MSPDSEWWAISGESFLVALRRAHEGENPDMLYIEFHANADHPEEES